MSWAVFKSNILRQTQDGMDNIDDVASIWANEYDACIKRGFDLLNFIPIQNGNKALAESLFKIGLKVAVLMALIHSFGMIANEYVNKEQLFEMRISAAEARLTSQAESGDFSEEDIAKERELFEERKATNSSIPPNLLVFGASRVLFVMLFGALYSFVIPIVLRQSPQLKGLKKN